MLFSVEIIEELEKLDPQVRAVFLRILKFIEKAIGEVVKREDFLELKREVEKLAKTVAELAEAQKRTEGELRHLIGEHRKTMEQLGGLTHTVGYIFEDRAYKGLPELIRRDFAVDIIEFIKRDFIF